MTGQGHPLDDLIQELTRLLQVRTIPPLDATVDAQSADGSLDLTLSLADDTRALWGVERGYKNVPLVKVGGWTLKIPVGSRVVLEFLDSDPRKPIVRELISGKPTEATLDADLVNVGGTGGLDAARKTDAVSSTADFVTWATAVKTQIIAAGGGDVGLPPVQIGTITGGSSKVKEVS